MAAKRYFAFKDSAGTYYKYKDSAHVALQMITYNPNDPGYDYDANWMDATLLDSLTADNLIYVGGMSLEIYSMIDDDDYTITMNSFIIHYTTNTSHFMLTNISNISGLKINGTGDLYTMLSFDNRNTWWYVNSSGAWEQTYPVNLCTKKSMTAATVNSITAAKFAEKFVKGGTLDYAIAIANDESLDSVVMTVPANTAPVIESISLTGSPVHKGDFTLNCTVTDIEDDRMTYEFYVKESPDGVKPAEKIVIDSGDVNPALKGNLTYTIHSSSFTEGIHTLYVAFIDDKGARSIEKTVQLEVSNTHPAVSMSYSGVATVDIVITDADNDKVQYKVLINDTEIAPMTSFASVPVNATISIPYNLIDFGKDNVIKVVYQDDIKENPLLETTYKFTGEYYGILFVDVTESKYDSTGKPNPNYYYSNSIGDIIKKLQVKDTFRNKESKLYTVGLYNYSGYTFSTVTLKSTQVSTFADMLISDKTPFDYTQGTITFTNVKSGDSPREFYVRIVSRGNDIGPVDEFINASTTL